MWAGKDIGAFGFAVKKRRRGVGCNEIGPEKYFRPKIN
jgi:hypothetical protein